MARDLDDLEPSAFERLVNDVLLAEYGARGRFVPYATPSGRTDGGYDGSYDGELRGVNAHWTVSAKRVANGTIGGLQDNVRDDIERYPGRRWWIVTNVSIPPGPLDARFRNWLGRRAPGSDWTAREELDALLRKHRWVARAYGVGDGTGYDVFRPAVLHAAAQGRPALPAGAEEAVRRVRDALDAGKTRVFVVGTRTSRLDAVLAAVVHDLVQSPVGHHVPVWVEARERERLQALGSPTEIQPDATSYTFVVPPSGVAGDALRLLGRLPGSHTVVAGLTPIQAHLAPMVPSPERVDLAPLTPEEMRDWVQQLDPTSRLDQVAAVVALSGDQPDAAASLVQGDHGLLLDLASEVIAAVRGDAGDRGDDALAWTLLLVPISRPAAGPSPEIAAVAQASGLSEPDVERLVDRAVAEGLLKLRALGGWDERSPVLTAAVVRRLVRAGSRFPRGVPSLEGGLAWRAARRLAQFTELEQPLLDALAVRREQVDDPDYLRAERAVADAAEVAPLSPRIAAAALEVAARATERLRAGVPFDRPAGLSERWDPTASFRRTFALKIADLLVGVGWWREHLQPVVRRLLDLATIDAELPLVRLGSALADPLHSSVDHLDALITALADGGEGSTQYSTLLVGAAEQLLADGVRDQGTVGNTFSFGILRWNEAEPRVAARRDRLGDVLLHLVREGAPRVRRVAWRGLEQLWRSLPWTDSTPPPPPGVRALADRVLSQAERTFRDAEDWDEWTGAERVVLQYVARSLASPERLALALRSFRTDPEYQVWRLLVRRTSFLGDPGDVAAVVERGGGWNAVVERMAEFRSGRAVPPIAARIAASTTTVDGVVRLLERVADARRVQGDEWGAIDILEAWIELAPDLFRRLLFGPDWARVPSDLRAWVLHAAARCFGEELAQASTGPTVSGATLGAALQIARFLQDPRAFPEDEGADLLPAAIRVLPLANRAAALFEAADHPGQNVRVAVARELCRWLRLDTPKPAATDAVAIVRRLAARAAPPSDGRNPDFAIWTLVRELDRWPERDDETAAPPDLRTSVDEEVGWAIVGTVERGALWRDEPDPTRFVTAAVQRDPSRWLDAVARSVATGRSSLEAISPPIGDLAHVNAILDRARASGGIGAWERVLARPVGALDTEDAQALISAQLTAGRVSDALTLFGLVEWPELDDEIASLGFLVAAASPEQIAILVEELARRGTNGAYNPLRHTPDDRARPWFDAAQTSPPAVRDVLRRVGERIQRLDQATQEGFDDAD